MESQIRGVFRLNVLNAGGRDPEQDFAPNELSGSRESAHAPVNFHAYAACTGGSFLRDARRALETKAPVLLLLRGDFRASERALDFLKKAGLTVTVSLKETGLHQIANQLADASKLSRFRRLLERADGYIAPTPEAEGFARSFLPHERVAYIPTPYPLHDGRWDFSQPSETKHGILVGTREFEVPSRNHLAALCAAKKIGEETGEAVTVYNCDGRKGAALLAGLEFAPEKLRILKRAGSYADYLRVVAGHKIVFQLDTSFVPGQVAGDALLCRIACVGGNGAIEREAFSDSNGVNRSISQLSEIALRLLRDENFYKDVIANSQARGHERLSFSHGARALADFLTSLQNNNPRAS